MKRSVLSVIILTLTIINLVLNVLIVFCVVPTANRTNELIGKIVRLVDLDISDFRAQGNKAVSVDNLETKAITSGSGEDASGKITVNLKSYDGKSHFAVINAYITLDKTSDDYASKSGSIDNAMPLITGTVTTVVSQYDVESAKDPAIQEEMKAEILSSLKELFQSDMIYSVVFESIIIQ